MSDAHSFFFAGWEVSRDRQSLFFRYRMAVLGKEREFTEEIRLPQPIPEAFPVALQNFLMQNLHLILGISYWKLTCPASIVIEPFRLNEEQSRFWNTVYTKGLGEFFYRNSIDFRGLIHFPPTATASVAPLAIDTKDEPLVGIAGGKDSLLSARLLEEAGIPFTGIVFETGKSYPLIEEVLPFIGVNVLKIRRIIDPQLYELNGQGVYNGHIPISAVYAFLGLAVACFYGYRYMIVSNERSASYGNVMYYDMEINHQWSKSEEFERLFSGYVKKYITPAVGYFSLLRPLSELQIVKRFVRYKELLPHFSSCNRNFAITASEPKKWCGQCPKCAFVFSLLAAYLPKDEVVKLFGKNLFEDESLLPLYRQLLGMADFKPFECVGTPEEVSEAFVRIGEKHEFDQTPAMKMYTGNGDKARKSGAASGLTDTIPEPYRKLIEKQL